MLPWGSQVPELLTGLSGRASRRKGLFKGGKKEEKSSFPAEGEARAKAWRPVSMGAVQEWEEGGGGRRNRASPGEMLNILSSGGMWILENVHSCSVGKRCEGAQEGGDLEIGEEATEWSDQRWWGLD